LTRVRDVGKQARHFSWALLVLASALAAFSLWREHPTRAAVVFGVGLLALSSWLGRARVRVQGASE